MFRPFVRVPILLAACVVSSVSCSERSPIAPTGQDAGGLQSGPSQNLSTQPDRPIKGDCTTTITFIDADTAGQCAAFEPVPSVYIAIGGTCTISHLGRTELSAVQQLILMPDASGQLVVTELRNCSTFTAANGDRLLHTTAGAVEPAGGADVAFSGSMTFAGGTGRFAGASGTATFRGTASLATNTGAFSFDGIVVY